MNRDDVTLEHLALLPEPVDQLLCPRLSHLDLLLALHVGLVQHSEGVLLNLNTFTLHQ